MDVKYLEETNVSYKQVYELLRSSYRQWQENGLDSAVSRYTLDDFISRVKNACVLVALSNEGVLIGTHTLVIDAPNSCFGKYLAIAPDFKRCGVGKMLFERECEIAREKGCKYILGDTSEKAYWSVKWHLKMGYKIVGYSSFSTNNYYSYLFRKQLVPSAKWDNPSFCKVIFYSNSLRSN